MARLRLHWLPVAPGLDASWVYAINVASPDTFAFGRDIVWMWGPLGYLLFAQDVGDHPRANGIAAGGLAALMLVPLSPPG